MENQSPTANVQRVTSPEASDCRVGNQSKKSGPAEPSTLCVQLAHPPQRTANCSPYLKNDCRSNSFAPAGVRSVHTKTKSLKTKSLTILDLDDYAKTSPVTVMRSAMELHRYPHKSGIPFNHPSKLLVPQRRPRLSSSHSPAHKSY